MPATIAAAKAGRHNRRVGAGAARRLRRVPRPDRRRAAPPPAATSELLAEIRERVDERLGASSATGIRILVGKPGLDGHSNGAEQIAVRARDVGMEVIYQGIRLTPEQIAASARDEDVDVVGLSILSGSHLELVPEMVRAAARAAASTSPVVVGGIIPARRRAGAARSRASPASTRPRTSRSTGS